MGKPKKVKKNKFNYSKNRRKAWAKSKQLPNIGCDQLKQAWDEKKSVHVNMREMGLSSDPNKTIRIKKTKELISPRPFTDEDMDTPTEEFIAPKGHVVQELEAEANLPQASTMRMSELDVQFCTSMLDRYGDDYKAMARDSSNHYQDTPKQIRRKINLFKSIPDQYSAYLTSKQGELTAGMDKS